jgi:hypothetical protein
MRTTRLNHAWTQALRDNGSISWDKLTELRKLAKAEGAESHLAYLVDLASMDNALQFKAASPFDFNTAQGYRSLVRDGELTMYPKPDGSQVPTTPLAKAWVKAAKKGQIGPEGLKALIEFARTQPDGLKELAYLNARTSHERELGFHVASPLTRQAKVEWEKLVRTGEIPFYAKPVDDFKTISPPKSRR